VLDRESQGLILAFCSGAIAIIGMVGCKGRVSSATVKSADDAPSADMSTTVVDSPALAHDVVAYARLCKQELGIDQPLPPMNCLNGVEVPITFNGTRLTAATWDSFSLTRKCDNPQWLQAGCWPYDLVQKIALGPDIEAVLNCRQKYFTQGQNNGQTPAERAKSYLAAAPDDQRRQYDFLDTFNDLALILKNKTTGKVCMFGMAGATFYGGRVAPPDEDQAPDKEAVYAQLPEPKPPRQLYPDSYWYKSAKALYFTPLEAAENGCVNCHDVGGFKTSPFIQQAHVVPSNHSKKLPFLLVGKVFQEAVQEYREVTTDPVNGQPQICTQCHRIPANRGTCNQYIDWATGNLPADLASLTTDFAKGYPQAAWMPDGHDLGSATEFNDSYGKHLQRLKCCCANPKFLGCQSRKYGPTEADVEVDWLQGQGPGSCR